MIRDIVLDTETTGLDPKKGDRLIEIGCIELLNRIPTGREFHQLINPQGRDVHPDAERIHGISTASLADKPPFRDIVDAFLDFIGADGQLVIHNANFDMGFINMELERIKRPPITADRVVDTLAIARRKHPAGPNTLDALCKRYGVDNSKRIKHGALMDSSLLADVYLELLGERQAVLGLAKSSDASDGGKVRSLKAKQLWRVMANTAAQAGMVLFITSTASTLSWSLTLAKIPQQIAALFHHLNGSATLFMLATIVTVTLMGALLEGLPALLIFGPLLLPIATTFGIDPVQYGIVLIISMGLGAFSPPIGVGMFVTCSIADTTMENATRHMLPYLAVLVIGLLLIAFVPWFSLVVPWALQMK